VLPVNGQKHKFLLQRRHYETEARYFPFSYPVHLRKTIAEYVLQGLGDCQFSILEVGSHAAQQTVRVLDLAREKRIGITNLMLVEPSSVVKSAEKKIRTKYMDVVKDLSIYNGIIEDLYDVDSIQKYDLIYGVGSIEYISDIMVFVWSMMKKIRIGGKLIFTYNVSTAGREIAVPISFAVLMTLGWLFRVNLTLLLLFLCMLWVIGNYMLLCIQHMKILNFFNFLIGLGHNLHLILSRNHGINEHEANRLALAIDAKLHKIRGFLLSVWVFEVTNRRCQASKHHGGETSVTIRKN